MTPDDVARIWEANAEGWTEMSRAGYDRCRDLFNTPAFMKMLPPVDGLSGIDIGCGEGHNTRRLADRGARMSAIDIAPTFIRHAREHEENEPRGIEFVQASATSLPFDDDSFDFATAFMSLQDIAEQKATIAEVHRVVRPGGFFQFSMIHPCFQTPKWGWILDDSGRRVALTVGDYFTRPPCRVEEWTFGAAPAELKERYAKFKTPYFEHTLSHWLNMLIEAGFALEAFEEPTPDGATLEAHPEQYDARIVAYFLIVRGRVPAG